jgi:golgi phosphoprotein 3
MRTIAEELLLLALDDEKGTTQWSGTGALPFGLAGALLAELVLRGKMTLGDKQCETDLPAMRGNQSRSAREVQVT